MQLRYLTYSVLIILVFTMSVFSGTTGKIAGRITDGENGEPLIGANVVVKGTTFGASSDLEGYYVILNLPPGIYTLEVMYIGYNTKEITNVQVSIDLTTTIDITLSETTLETTEIVTVVAERPAIKQDLTASTSVVDNEEIAALPITEINEILELQAGYVDGHMRGGRTGEIAYWIDGIPVTDAYDGGTVVEINKDMVQELQVVSGAFNAEYGNAMSGIVNVVTKEGTNEFGGNFTTYIGDYASNKTDIFWNVDDINPTAIYNFDGSIHGAVLPGKLFYFINGRHIYFDGWYQGKDVYEPHNIATFNDTTGAFIPYRNSSGRGNGKYVPMNWNRKNYGQVKLIFKPWAGFSILSSTIYDQVNYRDFDRSYKLNPSGDLKRFRTGFTQMVKMTHAVTAETFYDLGVTSFFKEYKHFAYEDPNDPRYVHPNVGLQLPFSFKTGGTNNSRFKRETLTVLGKFDLTSQVTRTHQIKTGVEVKQHRMTYEDITIRPVQEELAFDTGTSDPFITTDIPPDSSIYAAHYERNPIEASFYIQDKMEFEDFIINLGIRFDYFDPDGRVLADPSDPEIYSPIRPENRYRDLNGNGRQDVGEPSISVAEREEYWYEETDPKFQISPRLGIAFPISSRGKVYFSYGYFFQRPRFELLYTNPDYDIPLGGTAVMGNSDLEPEKTIQGELGLQQQLTDDITLDATIYFRDVRDLTGTRADAISIFGSGRIYRQYVNSDFGLIKGFIMSLNRRFSGGISGRIDYTYQVASGTASDPQDSHRAREAGQLPEVQLVPLNWDQRHTVNASFAYASENWGFSLIGQYGSGLPYTPRASEDISSLLINSSLKPNTYNVDLKAHRDFTFYNYRFTTFMRVFNLLDHLNEVNVYDDTGRAGETIDQVRARQSLGEGGEWVNTLDEWFTNATHYSEPRRVELGLTFRF